MNPKVKVFSTEGAIYLAEGICDALRVRLPDSFQEKGGLRLSETRVERFSNENIRVKLLDSAENYFTVVVHTQAPPVSDGMVELLSLLDAIFNSWPYDILLALSYMPYARSDNKDEPRVSVMAKFWADILNLRVKKVLLLDPHDSHVKGYFTPIADEVTVLYMMAHYLINNVLNPDLKKKAVVVFPDAGSARRFRSLPGLLEIPRAYIDKNRSDGTENPDIEGLVGSVKRRICIVPDDEILTGGTALKDAQALKDAGADKVIFVATHPILHDQKISDSDLLRILTCPMSPIDQFVVTNSVPVAEKVRGMEKIKVLSVEGLLAEAIKRKVLGGQIADLHQMEGVVLYI